MSGGGERRSGDGDLAGAAAAAAFRDEHAAVLATLIRHVGDFQLAEDAVQDAFVAALATWRRDGVPANPGAWITVAARRRAIDRLRRDQSLSDRTERLAELLRLDQQEQVFAGPLKGSRASHEVQSVRFVGADAAIVISQGAIIPAGQTEPDAETSSLDTWVLSRQDGTWRVEAFHNCSANAT